MPRRLSPAEQEVQDYIAEAQAGRAGVDPQAQTLARSKNPYQAAQGQRQVNQQLAGNARAVDQFAADTEREAVRMAKEQERASKQSMKDAMRAASEQEARLVREGAAAGVQTVTDTNTGKRTLATREDGSAIYKPGPVGKPQPLVAPTNDPTQPAPLVGMQQTFRNDRGETKSQALPTQTDPKTGAMTVSGKDAFGAPTKTAVGVDPSIAQKQQRLGQLDQDAAATDLKRIQLQQARAQFEPRWQPVKAEFTAAKAKLDSLANNYVLEPNPKPGQPARWGEYGTGGQWKPLLAPGKDDKFLRWQQDMADAKRRVDNATKQYQPLAGQHENLTRAERDARMGWLNNRAEKIRIERGLPDDDHGISMTLARAEDPSIGDPHEDAVNEVIGAGATNIASTAGNPSPLQGSNASNEGISPTTVQPAPATPAVQDAFKSLQGLQGVTVQDQGAFTQLNRNGQWIGSLEKTPGGDSIVTLRDAARGQEDILQIVKDTDKGVPIYLRDNPNRPKPVDEAAKVAGAFQTMSDPVLAGDSTAIAKALAAQGLEPMAIRKAVDAGEMSVQSGKVLLKQVWGDSLEADKFDDPANFQKWLEETSKPMGNSPFTPAKRWQKATSKDGIPGVTSGFSLDDQAAIKMDYARDYALKNAGKPGVDREAIRGLYAQAATASGGRVTSMANGLRDIVVNDVIGSMLGMVGGAVIDLGAGEAAILGNEDGKKALAESVRMRGRDWANWKNAAGRNAKAWGTSEGRKISSELTNSLRDLRTTIDSEADSINPDQAKIDAAEMKVRENALALHNLNPDTSWPVTADTLDPNKDAALGSALADYKASGDPRAFALFSERLLMNNGRRQLSEEIMRKNGNQTGFFQSFQGATRAGWQEIASEMLADAAMLVTGGGSKAIQAGLRGVGAAGKAARVESAAARISKGLEEAWNFGIKRGTLQKPLGVMDKTVNAGVRAVQGAIGEGTEELVVSPGDDSPTPLKDFAVGMLGAVTLAPAAVATHAIRSVIPTPEAVTPALQKRNESFATRYNAENAGTAGFVPVTPEIVGTARALVNPQEHAQASSEIATLVDQHGAVKGDDEAATNQRAQLRQQATERIGAMVTRQDDSIQAARSIAEVPDPARRTFLTGVAKVAAGNEAELTANERKAIQGATTQAGADYFESIQQPDGTFRETITREAAEELATTAPAVARLISTPTAQTNVQQPQPQVGSTAPAPLLQEAQPQVSPAVTGPAGMGTKVQGGGGTPLAGTGKPGLVTGTEPASLKDNSKGQGVLETNAEDPFTPTAEDADALQAELEAELAGETSTNSPQSAPTLAEITIQRAQARYPGLPARFAIDDAATGKTGGASANGDTVTIHTGDLEKELSGFDPAKHNERIDAIIDEEIVHLAQFEAARRMDQDVTKFYGELWNEFTPEQQAAAAETYQAEFDKQEDWQKAAETVRMLIQARADGKVTELTKAFSKNMPARLVEMLRHAVEFLRSAIQGGEVSQRIQDTIAGIEAILSEYSEQTPSADMTPAKTETPTGTQTPWPKKAPKEKAARAAKAAAEPTGNATAAGEQFPAAPRSAGDQKVLDVLDGLFSSPTSKQDAAYLKAVESGDMETAQRMVDEAAKAAGYTIGPVWHGSSNPNFTTFSRSGETDTGAMGAGFYFDESKRTASAYSANPEDPALLRAFYLNVGHIQEVPKGVYDETEGVFVHDGNSDSARHGSEWVVRDASRIKSADPVTYDANGKVIPLSQRFDSSKDSILYNSPTGESFTKTIPQDRFMKLMDAAQTWFAEGVTSPEAVAAKMDSLVPDGRLRPFSQSLWFALKAVGAEGVAEPNWKGIYQPAEAIPNSAETESKLGVGEKPDAAPAESPERAKPKKRRQIDSPARREAFALLRDGNTEFPILAKLIGSVGQITPPPANFGLIRAKVRRKEKLTNSEAATWKKFDGQYNGVLFQNDLPDTKEGKVARAALSMATARQGEGMDPDKAAQGINPSWTPDQLWTALRDELGRMSRPRKESADDPNRQTEPTAEEIAKAEKAKAIDPEKQAAEFEAANQPGNGGKPISVEDFTTEMEGQYVTVDGERMMIASVDWNSFLEQPNSVTLQDGTRFGRQVLEDGEIIYAEEDPSEEPRNAKVAVPAKQSAQNTPGPAISEQKPAQPAANWKGINRWTGEWLKAVEDGLPHAQLIEPPAGWKNTPRSVDVFTDRKTKGKVARFEHMFIHPDGRHAMLIEQDIANGVAKEPEAHVMTRDNSMGTKGWEHARNQFSGTVEKVITEIQRRNDYINRKEGVKGFKPQPPSLTLETQTDEQIKAEAEAAKQKAEIQKRQDKRLTGSTGDLTADMFGEGSTPLFNEQRNAPAKPKEPEAEKMAPDTSENRKKKANLTRQLADIQSRMTPYTPNEDPLVKQEANLLKELRQLTDVQDITDGPQDLIDFNPVRGTPQPASPASAGAQTTKPAQASVEVPDAGGIDQRIAEAEADGITFTDADKAEIRRADEKAKELRRKADRLSGMASDPLNKGNAFPMGVGFTRESKRSNQRIDASVRRAGESVAEAGKAKSAEAYRDALLQGKGTQGDKLRKAQKAEDFKREMVKQLLTWKKGDKFREWTIERVNNDRDGYPISFNFSGEGIIKGVMDKIDVLKDYFDGDREKMRKMITEERAKQASAKDAAGESLKRDPDWLTQSEKGEPTLSDNATDLEKALHAATWKKERGLAKGAPLDPRVIAEITNKFKTKNSDSLPGIPQAPGRIEDFGEKIVGARKDTWGRFKSAIEQELPEDTADITISKYFPEPDYETSTANGVSADALATYKAIRDSIPPKPRKSYKLRGWADMVRGIHPLMQKLAVGTELSPAEFTAMDKLFYRGGDLSDKINLYKDLGYPAFTKADDWKIIGGVSQLMENGVRLEKPIIVTSALNKGRFVSGMTAKEEGRKSYIAVLDMIREKILREMEAPATKNAKPVEFNILTNRISGEIFIGRKALNGWVRLKTGFADSKEARQYLADNQAALEEQWNGLKKPVDYRKQVNAPRQGPTRREGDVTPDLFQDTFGFRGVQFGNWVEGDRRQVDINEAFDAFMDLADALGIPPKAVSLDGSLGLAFGARGIPNAKAHYEPGQVVINLTKKTGPGSLGHEWFHGFDNYFARLDKTGETKAQALDKFATNFSNAPKNMRPEVWEAFKQIRLALDSGPFAKRSKELDQTKSKPYYSTIIEKAARAFERYTVDRLKDKEISNDFLVNLSKDESPALPTQDEMNAGIRQAYDNLFNILDTKETDKGTMLFSSPASSDGRLQPIGDPQTIRTTDGRILTEPTLFASRAYHGTPHKVDKFSLDKIGTGEGAQAYGWGLYFAESREVGEEYRKNLADFKVTLDGSPMSAESLVVSLGPNYPGYLDGVINATGLIQRWMEAADKSNPYDPGTQRHALWSELQTRATSQKGGNLYAVTLEVNDEDLLDWGKPVTEQSPKVIQLLKDAGLYVEKTPYGARAEGQYIYHSEDTSPRLKSARLMEAGIPGMRYLDGNSRNRPLKDIKKDFLDALPEDAEIEDVKQAIADGVFNAKQIAFLDALQADDWLGFEYPAQAISAALSDKVSNWDASPELLATIDPLRGEVTYNYVIFDESKIKITEENGQPVNAPTLFSSRTRDTSTPTQATPSPAFYSQLARTLEAKMPKTAPVDQVIQIATSGAKAEEIKWSGIVQAAQRLASENSGKVDKAKLLEWLNTEGSVRFEEVQSGDNERVLSKYGYVVERGMDGEPEIYDEQGDLTDFEDLPEEVQRAITDKPGFAEKYRQYVLPGGENYREVVLAMPLGGAETTSDQRKRMKERYGVDSWFDLTDAQKEELKVADEKANSPRVEYTSSHFPDVPNYVAHMRLNERDGGLFIEELQSDRHQDARKNGYAITEGSEVTPDMAKEFFGITDADWKAMPEDQRQSYVDEIKEGGKHLKGGIADAPFRKDWPLALFKRALRDAVASGKEWIGWTVGKTQNDRFSLAKQITALRWNNIDGNGKIIKIEVKQKGFSGYKDMGEHADTALPNLIGKEMAERIITKARAGREYEEYSGLDLEVGDKGMIGFYDNILPKEIGKYVRQWGGKVEMASVDAGFKESSDDDTMTSRPERIERNNYGFSLVLGNGEKWGAWSKIEDAERGLKIWQDRFDARKGTPIWRIDITPAMKSGVEQGQALFSSPSRRDTQTPDLFAAVNAPDAAAKLGDVKAGRMHALNAYKTLTAKRDKVGLSTDEEQKLLEAETALGQKLAFDMESVKGEAPQITQSADARALAMMNRKGFTREDDVIRKQIVARLKKAGADEDLIHDITVGKFLDMPESAPTARPAFGSNTRQVQDEMSRAGEIGKGGQISLLSSGSSASSSNEAGSRIPGSSIPSGRNQRGQGRGAEELRDEIVRAAGDGGAERLGEGGESIVSRFGADRVLKIIKPRGIWTYKPTGGLTRSIRFEDVELKAQTIRLLGGLDTTAIEADGQNYMVQERGEPITQSEYESIELPFNIRPSSGTQIYRIEIDGQTLMVSDLIRDNFLKKANGEIGVSDLIVGKVDSGKGPLDEVDSSLLASPTGKRADPLLTAIKALVEDPEKKAETFARMSNFVNAVRRRFDNNRLKADFSKQGIDTARYTQIRDVAILEAIAKALPMELRGKLVGSFRQLDMLKTERGRENYLLKMLPKIEGALETHLQKLYRQEIRKVIDKSQPRSNDSRNLRGKIGAVGHAIARQAVAAMTMTSNQALKDAASIREEIEAMSDMDLDTFEEMEGKAMALELFSDYEEADSARLEKAAEFLKGVYTESREQWLAVLKARKEQKESDIETLRDAIKAPEFISNAMLAQAKKQNEKITTRFADSMLEWISSYEQILSRLKENTSDPKAIAWVDAQVDKLRDARGEYDDRVEAERLALETAMEDIFKTRKGWLGKFDLDPILNNLSKRRDDHGITILEGVKNEEIKVPVNLAESIVRREVSGYDYNGKRYEITAQDMPALEEAWERHLELPDDAQAAKRVIKFTRHISTGTRNVLGQYSQLELLKEWLAMRQTDLAAKYKSRGWDETTMEQMEKVLTPEVKRLGLWMVDQLESQRAELDAKHRGEYGIGLDMVENYFPALFEAAQNQESNLTMDGADTNVAAKTASALKSRVAHSARPRQMNALSVFLSNRAQVHYFMTHATPLREMLGVFRSTRANEALRFKLGENFTRTLGRELKLIETNGQLNADGVLEAERFIRKVQSGYALGILGLKLSTLAINTTAAMNTLLGVSAGKLVKGFTPEYVSDLKKFFDTPAIRRRLKHGTSHEVRIAAEGGIGGHPLAAGSRRIAQESMQAINWWDTFSNGILGAAAYRAALEEARAAGLTEAQAIARAEKEIDRLSTTVMQPNNLLSRSVGEVKLSQNPMGGLMFMFATEPRKNIAIGMYAMRKILTGKGAVSSGMAAQQLIVLGTFYSALGYLIRSAYQAAFKGDDDEPEELLERLHTRMTDAKGWTNALMTEHLKGVPILGESMGRLITGIINEAEFIKGEKIQQFDSSPNPLNRMVKAAFQAGGMGDEKKSPEQRTDTIISTIQGTLGMLPETAILSQAGNVAKDALGYLTSNGMELSQAEKIRRMKARFGKFQKSLPKATDAEGKTDPEAKFERDRQMADYLQRTLHSLQPADQAAFREAIDKQINDDVRGAIGE